MQGVPWWIAHQANGDHSTQPPFSPLSTPSAKREEARRRNWRQVAEQAGVNQSTLTRLARGKRPDVDTLAALVDWAGLKADDYVVRVHQNEPVNPLAMISTYFRGDCNLTPEAAAALEKVVKATYEALRQS